MSSFVVAPAPVSCCATVLPCQKCLQQVEDDQLSLDSHVNGFLKISLWRKRPVAVMLDLCYSDVASLFMNPSISSWTDICLVDMQLSLYGYDEQTPGCVEVTCVSKAVRTVSWISLPVKWACDTHALVRLISLMNSSVCTILHSVLIQLLQTSDWLYYKWGSFFSLSQPGSPLLVWLHQGI